MVGLCRPYIGIKLVSLDKVVHIFTDPPYLPKIGLKNLALILLWHQHTMLTPVKDRKEGNTRSVRAYLFSYYQDNEDDGVRLSSI